MPQTIVIYNAKQIYAKLDEFIKKNGEEISSPQLRPILVDARVRIE